MDTLMWSAQEVTFRVLFGKQLRLFKDKILDFSLADSLWRPPHPRWRAVAVPGCNWPCAISSASRENTGSSGPSFPIRCRGVGASPRNKIARWSTAWAGQQCTMQWPRRPSAFEAARNSSRHRCFEGSSHATCDWCPPARRPHAPAAVSLHARAPLDGPGFPPTLGLVTSACVSSPRDWAVSIGSHMQQDVGIS